MWQWVIVGLIWSVTCHHFPLLCNLYFGILKLSLWQFPEVCVIHRTSCSDLRSAMIPNTELRPKPWLKKSAGKGLLQYLNGLKSLFSCRLECRIFFHCNAQLRDWGRHRKSSRLWSASSPRWGPAPRRSTSSPSPGSPGRPPSQPGLQIYRGRPTGEQLNCCTAFVVCSDAYFARDGRRKGYEVENADLLINTKYAEVEAARDRKKEEENNANW